jgi:hypothetical protein
MRPKRNNGTDKANRLEDQETKEFQRWQRGGAAQALGNRPTGKKPPRRQEADGEVTESSVNAMMLVADLTAHVTASRTVQ